MSAGSGLGPPVPLAAVTGPASSKPSGIVQIASGTLVERYGYVNDDPAARFILRELLIFTERLEIRSRWLCGDSDGPGIGVVAVGGPWCSLQIRTQQSRKRANQRIQQGMVYVGAHQCVGHTPHPTLLGAYSSVLCNPLIVCFWC